jgi:hypothetical protein
MPVKTLRLTPLSGRAHAEPERMSKAVFLRVSMLQRLKRFSERTGHVFPWLHDGKPDDAMFELFATGKAVSELQKILKEAGA